MTQTGTSSGQDNARALAAVGLDDEAERVYRHVLDRPASTQSDVAANVGLPVSRARRVLTTLEHRGLVSPAPTRPLRYTAMAPQVALEALIQHHLQQMSAVRATGEQLQKRFHDTVGDRAFDVVELLTAPEAISQRFTQMEQTAQREIAVLDRPPYFLPDTTNLQVETHALRRGIHCRGIYDQRAFEVPGRLERIHASVRDGEQARLITDLPLKLALVDDSAMVSLLGHPGDQRTLVINRSALVAGLYMLFELLWQRAVPLGAADLNEPEHDQPDGDAQDREIVALLAGGLPDKVIARQLGLSLRTVARRVSTIMNQLDAQTRFQAGAQAAARGWLDTS